MLAALTIPSEPSAEPGLNQADLYDIGLQCVQRLGSNAWSDYNVHDPGITTLELLSYALSDLSYRATYPVADLLARAAGSSPPSPLFSARTILPNRALTLVDYRKLVIDIKGVRNAWLEPAEITYFADASAGILYQKDPGLPHVKQVDVRGVYDVVVDLVPGAKKTDVLAAVRERLHTNRNLCEDFADVAQVATRSFLLCCELELSADSDPSHVEGEVFFRVQEYLSPTIRSYTLEEMLGRTKGDGAFFTVDEIFDGPALDCGFIDDDELRQADLRGEIYLSDVISIIMDIDGVLAVRDILINPDGTPGQPSAPTADKWVIAVEPRTLAVIDRDKSRLFFYKRNAPVMSDHAVAEDHYDELVDQLTTKIETAIPYDLDVPQGRYRQPSDYYSFQNHFPRLYGLSEYGLNVNADERRRALVWQLKGYLLFFDQIMANYLAQIGHLAELFSSDPGVDQTYFSQPVDSFAEAEKIYGEDFSPTKLQMLVEEESGFVIRRNRFLDHLIARFAEEFSVLATIGNTPSTSVATTILNRKCDFLQSYPDISGNRSIAYNYTRATPADLWDSANVSGLEKRLAKLLGIGTGTRHDLSGGADGLYLLEMILLRPEQSQDPFVKVCPDPYCTDCADEDPYSYRVQVILPAEQDRFADMDYRRFVEEIIRQEMPAHILPRICWINQADMAELEKAYKDWISLKAGADTTKRKDKLNALIDVLSRVRSVYPSHKLIECKDAKDKFLVGQTALGSLPARPSPIRRRPGRRGPGKRAPARRAPGRRASGRRVLRRTARRRRLPTRSAARRHRNLKKKKPTRKRPARKKRS